MPAHMSFHCGLIVPARLKMDFGFGKLALVAFYYEEETYNFLTASFLG